MIKRLVSCNEEEDGDHQTNNFFTCVMSLMNIYYYFGLGQEEEKTVFFVAWHVKLGKSAA